MESVVVARVRIAQDVSLEAEAPDALHLAGHPEELALKFCYEYREVRHDRDPFRLTLRAWTKQEMETARLEHQDHFLRPDDEDGFLVVKLRVPRHDADVHWEAHVHRTTEPWGGGETSEADATVDGVVRVRRA